MTNNFFTFTYLLVFSNTVFGWSALTDSFDIHCQQNNKNLDCEYRALSKGSVSSVDASSNNIELDITENSTYPGINENTAVLFLVDTSDPRRQNAIEKKKKHIKEIISTQKSHHDFGLASFDKSLKILAPISTSPFLLSKSVDTLTATGKTTELYRNLLKAMEHLDATTAKRKVIALLSDGQAEDKAYFHTDIIKMARKSNIIINSIGYPRSVSLSVALQTLRRLSEETGGRFIETDMGYNLSANEINQFFENIDNGKSFSVSLNKLYEDENTAQSVSLSIATEKGIKRIKIPVNIEIKKKPAIDNSIVTPTKTISTKEKEPAVKKPATAPIQIITKQPPAQPINLWLWYGLPAAFIIIIIFILITLYLLWRKPAQQNSTSENDYKPYAYLIANDENETRYPITRTICRIGRSKDNELSLDDTSISRRHAEIHRNNDGSFDIIDMNSMNGVYINNEKVGKAQLHEGDILEIGDYFLHFTQLASDYSLEESTVMQKTRTPTH